MGLAGILPGKKGTRQSSPTGPPDRMQAHGDHRVHSVITIAGKKKADLAEHPWVFDQVGLHRDRPPGIAGLPFKKSSEIDYINCSTNRPQVCTVSGEQFRRTKVIDNRGPIAD